MNTLDDPVSKCNPFDCLLQAEKFVARFQRIGSTDIKYEFQFWSASKDLSKKLRVAIWRRVQLLHRGT